MKQVVDLIVGCEEALSLAGRFELLHLPLSSARRLVRILRSVVQSLVLAMLNAGHDVPLRRAVAGELISDHDAWRWHLLLQQLAQHPLGSIRWAAGVSRRRWTRTSSTMPVWSTARHNQCFTPAISSTTSSRCHLSPTRGRRRRI